MSFQQKLEALTAKFTADVKAALLEEILSGPEPEKLTLIEKPARSHKERVLTLEYDSGTGKWCLFGSDRTLHFSRVDRSHMVKAARKQGYVVVGPLQQL